MQRWSFNKVKYALEHIVNNLEAETPDDIEYFVYYAGGSLCIDFKFSPSVVLNKNGRGFFYKFTDSNVKSGEVQFVMTNYMQDIVNRIYKLASVKKRPKYHEILAN